jgi:hypothetical protein
MTHIFAKNKAKKPEYQALIENFEEYDNEAARKETASVRKESSKK